MVEKKVLTKIVATDRFKSEYEHEVILKKVTCETKESHGQWVLDFGSSMQYGVIGLLHHYPYATGVCIDISGRLHGASGSVVVSADDMNKLLLLACDVLEIDPEDYARKATDAPSTTPPPRNEALEDMAKMVRADIDTHTSERGGDPRDAGHSTGVQKAPGDVQRGPNSEDLQHASDRGDGHGEDVPSKDG